MPGANALEAMYSYIGVGRETTWGTGVTAPSGLNFLSSSLKTMKDNKLLEQVERDRVYSQSIRMGKVVSGAVEFYYDPECPAANYLLQNAMGGSISTATNAGETTGGTGYEHTFGIGNIALQSYSGITINSRKGDSTNGKVFEYYGGRVNEMVVSSELDEALKISADMIFQDSTQNSNDIESALVNFQSNTISFIGGQFTVDDSVGSIGTTSWQVQSFELTISNNLKSDNESRRIGSDLLSVLPAGIASLVLSVNMRFDTLTAYDAMLNGTNYTGQLLFSGDTMAGSNIARSIGFNMPRLQVKDAGDPEIGGPDGFLVSNVIFDVLKDASSSSGYALNCVVNNLVSSYS